jgi:hypothetical protein
MKLIKCFAVFGLCFLTGTCGLPSNLDIDIGGYNKQLEAWNSQNMLDYQMVVRQHTGSGGGKRVIYVKNGNPIRPPGWIANGWRSTVPEFYSFIKEREKTMRDWNKEDTDSYRLKVKYDTTYHYPCEIVDSIHHTSQLGMDTNGTSSRVWESTVRQCTWGPIGNYEKQWEAWDKLNIHDYQLSVSCYLYNNDILQKGAIITVKNGIPESSDPPEWLAGGEMSTMPEFFSFIKEEEERIRGTDDSKFLTVYYDSSYHYPGNISIENYAPSSMGTEDYFWAIWFTPL